MSKTTERKEKGIIMQGHNVRAMIRPVEPKTVTRRLPTIPKYMTMHGRSPCFSKAWADGDPVNGGQYIHMPYGGGDYDSPTEVSGRIWPRYVPGDVLYIKEAWCLVGRDTDPDGWRYIRLEDYDPAQKLQQGRLRSSMFMPKWLARPNRFLVESVRAERLQDITEEGAIAEGIQAGRYDNGQAYYYVDNPADHESTARKSYLVEWDSIHTKPGTRAQDNPVIFAYTFKEIKK